MAASRPAPLKLPAWLLPGLLALTTIVLYWPAMSLGFVNYDDDRYVTANPQVQQGLTLAAMRWAWLNPVADNWHPLTVWSHQLVCQLAGLNPWGHHLMNVLLHAANAALVFMWLRRATSLRSDATATQASAVWKSLVVAALFAVHPLRVESVAWVAERKDVLSGCFGLLSLLAYVRFTVGAPISRHGSTTPRLVTSSPTAEVRDQRSEVGTPWSVVRGPWFLFYLLSLSCFALGLLSKPMLVTWPFVLLLLDCWPLARWQMADGRWQIFRRLVIEKIPFFALAVAAGVVTFIVQKRGAVMETVDNLSAAAQFENALIAYCRYLGKMFWPVDLAVFYPHPGHWPLAWVFLAGTFLLAVSMLLLAQRRRQPYLLVGWLWFLGTLVPVIGLVQVGLQSMADRYTYLPSLGILIMVVWGLEAWTRNWPARMVPLAVAASVAIVLCMVLTRMQLQYWLDGETLFRHASAVTVDNYVAHYNLGVALDEKGRSDDAMLEYQAALQIKPEYARAHVNLGLDLDRDGRANDAMREYQAAIHAEPDNPYARNNLGIALFNRGQNDEAIRQFQEAVRLAPDNASARNSLAAALYTQGQPDEAIQQFQAALRLQPDYAEAHFNLACVLAKRGQTDEAIRYFQEAIRLKPEYTEARDRLAKLVETRGK